MSKVFHEGEPCAHCGSRIGRRRRRGLCRRCYHTDEIKSQYARKLVGARPEYDPANPDTCRACGKRPGTRRRGCCRTCYLTRGLGRGKESPFKMGRQDHGERSTGRGGSGNGEGADGGETMQYTHTRPLPPEPTHHLPGTPEKAAVMAARLAAGYHLHHPRDAMRNDAREPNDDDFQPATVREPRTASSTLRGRISPAAIEATNFHS